MLIFAFYFWQIPRPIPPPLPPSRCYCIGTQRLEQERYEFLKLRTRFNWKLIYLFMHTLAWRFWVANNNCHRMNAHRGSCLERNCHSNLEIPARQAPLSSFAELFFLFYNFSLTLRVSNLKDITLFFRNHEGLGYERSPGVTPVLIN